MNTLIHVIKKRHCVMNGSIFIQICKMCSAYAEGDHCSLYTLSFLHIFVLDYDQLATGNILKQKYDSS